jgi:hypothetical protein
MRFVAILILLLTFSIFLPLQVHANVSQTDGNIGVVMHIDPDDGPVAHEQSTLSFEFNDKQNKFSANLCNCVFSIKKNGQIIYAQSLLTTDSPKLIEAAVRYTFPAIGFYQVVISGTPKNPNAFQPFTFTYEVQVIKEATQPSSPSQTTTDTSVNSERNIISTIVGVLGLGAIILFIGALRSLKRQEL